MDPAREVLKRHEAFLREFIQLGGNHHLINKAGQLLIDTCEVLRTPDTIYTTISLATKVEE
jgi:hypothetical protein